MTLGHIMSKIHRGTVRRIHLGSVKRGYAEKLRVAVSMVAFSALGLSGQMLASQQIFHLDTNKSRVEWHGRKVIGGSHNGTLGFKEGHLKAQGDLMQTAKFVVDLQSIQNEDVKDPKMNAKLVNHLKSDDFFDVEAYPTASFTITKIEKAEAPDTFKMSGDFTVKKTTKALTIEAKEHSKDPKQKHLMTSFSFDRADFDVRYASGRFFSGLGDKIISDEIKVTVHLQLDLQDSKQ